MYPGLQLLALINILHYNFLQLHLKHLLLRPFLLRKLLPCLVLQLHYARPLLRLSLLGHTHQSQLLLPLLHHLSLLPILLLLWLTLQVRLHPLHRLFLLKLQLPLHLLHLLPLLSLP